MIWKKIELNDKPIFDEYLNHFRIPISEFTFLNLILYNDSFQYKIVNNQLVIRSCYNQENMPIFFPIGEGDTKTTINLLRKEYQDNNADFSLRSLLVEQIDIIKQYFPDDFEFILDRDHSDYIYDTDDLIELRGRNLHKRKNLLNKFKKLYSYEYKTISLNDTSMILEFQHNWLNQIATTNMDLVEEHKGILLLLDNLDLFPEIVGGMLTVNGKVIAYSFGEQIAPDTVDIHIEKALTDYTGAYQAINQEYLLHHWNHVKKTNRECDMGVLGIRQAKEAYHPKCLLLKYYALTKK